VLTISGMGYYLFDTGMATAIMILKATDLGLVAHSIAGYDEETIKRVLKTLQELTGICINLELEFLRHKCARKRVCALPPPKPVSRKVF
jgi:hypothetical protein